MSAATRPVVHAASLLAVFIVARMAVLWGRSIDWSAWAVIAYLWQDILVAGIFGVAAWMAPRLHARRSMVAALYWAAAAYAALNIPVTIVLSTPLTWRMVRGTGGALADSILLYATWSNGARVGVTLLVAAIAPQVLARMTQTMFRIAFACAIGIVALGPLSRAHVDTIGLDRNALVALAASALPHVDARSASDPAAGALASFDPPVVDHSESARHIAARLRGRGAGRHVVLVSLESTAAQYLRLYGAREDVTPQLDRLARHAVVFDHAYAAYPESITGLFSILCSTFPAFDTTPEMYERVPCRSIARVLADAGYATGMFHSGRFGYLGMESIIRGRGFHTLEDAAAIGGHHESSFGVDEPSTVARMLSWIDALPDGQRFFLNYLPIAGHHPYEAPAPRPFPTDREIGRYRNALHYADRALGALVDGLRARGLEEETLWIVFGDHGEAMGQHDGNYGHTFFLYEENVRVPFLIAAPGLLNAQERSPTIVSLVDTAPTILDVLGIPAPAHYQGRSALDDSARVAPFFTDYSLGLVGLRDGKWKFVHEIDSGRSTLFDTQSDPGETIDATSREPLRVEAYARMLRTWAASQKRHVQLQ